MKRLTLLLALVAVACGSSNPPEISVFTAAPASIALGGSAQLIFTAEAGSRLSIDQGIGDVTGKTSVTVSPAADTTYTLTATKDDVSSTRMATVHVTASPSAAFRITGATSATAGTPFNVTLAALDTGGAVNANYRGTVHFTSDDPQGTVPADVTFAGTDNGQKTVAVTFRTAGPRTLLAQDTVVASSQGTARVQVGPAAAKTIALTGTPDTALAGDRLTLTVTAFDDFGNVSTGFTGTVQFASTDATAQLPADYTYTAADKGAHVFGVVLTRASVSTSITVSCAGFPAQQGTLRVNPAAAAQVTVDNVPQNVTVDVDTPVTLSVRDAYGNVATSYTGTVRVSSSDAGATGTGDVAFAAGDQGVKTVTLRFATAGAQSVSAADAGNAAIAGSASTDVKHGAAARLLLAGVPSGTVAGALITATVTALDSHGNVVKNFAGTVHFASTDAGATLPADATFTANDDGARSFALTLVTAGARSVTVSQVGGGATPSTANTAVANAPASRIALVAHTSPIAVDTSETVTATLFDAFGNPALDYTGTVHFFTSDPNATSIPDVTFAPAMFATADVSVQFGSAGAQSVLASDTTNGAISGSTAVAVLNGPAVAYALSRLPTSAVAGEPLPLTITAQDAHGNVVVNYTEFAMVLTTDASDRLPAAGPFVNGVRTVSVAFVTAGPHLATVKEIGGTISVDTSTVTVVPADANFFVIGGGAAFAGQNVLTTATVKDVFGNTVTTYSGTVTFTSSDANAVLPASYTFVSADQGQHTFTVAFHLAGSQTLTISDPGARGTATFTVTPDVAAACDVLDLPASAAAGAQTGLRVAVRDQFGNRATGYTGSVALSSSDAAAQLGSAAAFTSTDAGAHAFTVQLRTAGGQTVTATDSGARFSCQGSMTVVPGATVLTVTFAATDAWAGTAVNATVTAQDAFANRVSTYGGTVAFTSSDTLAARPANVTFAPADSGQKVVSVTFNSIGTQTLTATDTVTAAITGSGAQNVHGLVYTNPAAGGKVRLVLNSVGSSASVVQLDLVSNTSLFPVAVLDPVNPNIALPSSARNGVFAAGMNLPLDTTRVGPDTTLLRTAPATTQIFALGSAPQAVAASIANGILYSGVSQKRVDLSIPNCTVPNPPGGPCTTDHLRGDVAVRPSGAGSLYYSLRLKLTPGAPAGTVFDGQALASNLKFRAAVRDRSGSDVFSGTTDFAIGKLEVR